VTRIGFAFHIWPEGETLLPKLKEALGANFETVSTAADLLVYIRIPWNTLLKQSVNKEPEFKQDAEQRALLKQVLSENERLLDKMIDEAEEEHNVLVLDSVFFESDAAILEAAELIKLKARGK
jgi:hypothetical protein